MLKNYRFKIFIILVCVCFGLQAQTRTSYKDVLLNGKPARLNLATGEFILVGENGQDSIVDATRKHLDYSLERLNFHIVQENEKLVDIATQYGLSLKEIQAGNNLQTTLVNTGQKLRVRNFNQTEISSSNKETLNESIWVVKPGETLYRVSVNTGLTVKKLKVLNNLKDNNIFVGQKLKLK
ncbi:LysM peptidoglycan-binding domain-containing protein [Neotamlana laminarinivorans]|uniref:LysM peptidoglycan-binding domain-containing protein n=1 Tax=Neotamlana laminarinivorans TaxID=2883124 RepID=A0A9X1HXV0_9FLAO|nr:LysM peptidoglycan-binding domain-containing protein [Tamlana laminarinivorans]MCB4797920.1 LysM peptidoglycan-binding domain-containing protein [Tamlana laminarinivorans]